MIVLLEDQETTKLSVSHWANSLIHASCRMVKFVLKNSSLNVVFHHLLDTGNVLVVLETSIAVNSGTDPILWV